MLQTEDAELFRTLRFGVLMGIDPYSAKRAPHSGQNFGGFAGSSGV